MLINTPISLGELVDKISILIIKQKNITDETKLDHVKKELDFLQKTLMNYVQQEEINTYLENLININSKLWNIVIVQIYFPLIVILEYLYVRFDNRIRVGAKSFARGWVH